MLIRSFWQDFITSVRMWDIAFYFAWSDIKARYKRSLLGPFWIVLATMIGVVGLGLVWSLVLNRSFADMLPPLTLGMVFWQFMAGCITESTTVFFNNASIIKNQPNPYLLFIIKHLCKHLLLLLHNLLIVVAICICFGIVRSVADYCWFLLGLVLVSCNLFWLSLIFALLNVRYRDLEMILNSIMPILFFLTPVVFKSQQIASLKYLLYFNPFTSFITILREPLYQGLVNYQPFEIASYILLFGCCFTPLVYRRMSKELPFLI